MGVYELFNFDSEPKGTSPPGGWTPDTVHIPDNFEVDDLHSVSPLHSAWLHRAVGWGIAHHDVSFTTERSIIKKYFNDTIHAHYVLTQKTPGDFLLADGVAVLSFDGAANIRYYHGEVLTDSGYNYTAGWHVIEIVNNFVAGTFDVWYDDVLIISGKDFRNATATSVEGIQLGITGSSTWFDDIQIGEPLGQDDNAPSSAGALCGARI